MRRGVVAKRCGGERGWNGRGCGSWVAVCGSYADVRRRVKELSLRAHCRW